MPAWFIIVLGGVMLLFGVLAGFTAAMFGLVAGVILMIGADEAVTNHNRSRSDLHDR